MNDCANAEIRDLLPEMQVGSLGSIDRRRVETHLEDCLDCREELALLIQARAYMVIASPRVDVQRIVSALPAPSVSAPRVLRPNRQWSSWAAAAAVVVMLGSASAVMVKSYDGRPAPSDSQLITSTGSNTDGLTLTGRLDELSDVELKALIAGLDEIDGRPVEEADAQLVPVSGTGRPESELPEEGAH